MPLTKIQNVQVNGTESKDSAGKKNALSIKKNDSKGKFAKILKKIALKNIDLKTGKKVINNSEATKNGKTEEKLKNKKNLNIKFVRLENLVKENALERKLALKKKNAIKNGLENLSEKELKTELSEKGLKKIKADENDFELKLNLSEKNNSEKIDLGKNNELSTRLDLSEKIKSDKSDAIVKKSSSNKEVFEITVVDLRQKVKNRITDKKTDNNTVKIKSADGNAEDVKLTLLSNTAETTEALKENNSSTNIKDFKNIFDQYLKDKGNEDIVKKTKIILKNDNKGEIKLILKPEKMGNVRIKLNLNDNRIAGRIIVENNIVKEVFDNNMDMLNKALKAGGFESAGIDVFVGNNSGSGRGFEEAEAQAREADVFKIKTYDDLSNSVDENYESDTLINLVI